MSLNNIPIVNKMLKIVFSENIWPIIDQLIVSFGNFITGIILARSLSSQEFGVYSLVFSVMLLIYSLHSSLVIYPLSVRGAAQTNSELQINLGNSIFITIASTPVLGAGIFTFILLLQRTDIFLWATLSLMAWLLQEVVRRGLMARIQFRKAVFGDAISYLGQVVILILFAYLKKLDLSTAFIILLLTSGFAFIVQFLQAKPKWEGFACAYQWLIDCWNLGRWPLMGNAILPLTTQVYPWALALFFNATEVAKFNAITNLSRVINPIMFSMGNLIVPLVSKANKQLGNKEALKSAKGPAFQGGFVVMALLLVLLIFPRQALIFIYGSNSPYISLEFPLQVFTFAYIFTYVAQVFTSILNGLEKPKESLKVQVLSAVFTSIFGLPMIAAFGVQGATFVFLINQLLRSFLGGVYINKVVPFGKQQLLSETINS